jgi:ABC-type phosphate transport system substrate-binding protein
MVSVDSIDPTPENAEKRRYPLTGDLFVITKGTPKGWTKKFIAFVLGDEGQAIIGKRFGRVK